MIMYILDEILNIFNITTVFYIRTIDKYKAETTLLLFFLVIISSICILNYLFGHDRNDTLIVEWMSRLRWSYNNFIEDHEIGDSHNIEVIRNFDTHNVGRLSSANYTDCHYINNKCKLMDRGSLIAKISNFFKIPYSFSFYNLIFKKNQKLYDHWKFEVAFKEDKADSFVFLIIKNELVQSFFKKNKEMKLCSIYETRNPSVLSIITDNGYSLYCNEHALFGYMLKPDLLRNLALNNEYINYIFLTNKSLKNPANPNLMKFSYKLPSEGEDMFSLCDLAFDYITTVRGIKKLDIKKTEDAILSIREKKKNKTN